MGISQGEHVDCTNPGKYNCEDTKLVTGDMMVWKCLETGKNVIITVVKGMRFVVSQIYTPEEQ